jgi:hypothetical protein
MPRERQGRDWHMDYGKRVRLAGSALGRARHVCALFHDKEEEYRVLLPFIKEGFDQGDRALHIVDPARKSEHRSRLEREGIDVPEAEQRGQLEVRPWDDAYLQEGCFNQARMIALLEQVLAAGKGRGYPLTRLVADMEWALEDCPGIHDIVEYETRLNYMLPKYDDAVCCVYDVSRFNAAVIMDILRTHPTVIIGEVLHDNPFFVPPDQLLAELRARDVQGRDAVN